MDDHPVILEGLAALVAQHPRMTVVAQAESGGEALEAFELRRPDVTLADLGLPDMSGAELIARVRKRHREARFLVLSIHGGAEDVYRAVEAGCRGYLLKNCRREDLFRAIETVHQGGRYFPHAIASRLAERTAMDDLTQRELDVLRLLAAGKRDKEIASALALSGATVRSHLTSILSKLGVASRTQAILSAIELGLVRAGGA